MGKLSELVHKGVRLIVAETSEGAEPGAAAAAPDASSPQPPRRSRELTADELQVEPPKHVDRSSIAADVADFASVYAEAGIEVPAHGYGIEKVAEMLANKRFASLGREAKATAVLVALEAAGVAIRDVVQDAVQRDRALDEFEAAKEREASEARSRNDARIQELNRQLEELIQKINAEVQSLKEASEGAERALAELRTRKRREEERLREVVSHFIEGADNPITTPTSSVTQAPPAKPAE